MLNNNLENQSLWVLFNQKSELN